MSLDTHFLTALLFAFLGGFLPTLAWLFFWLRQDSENPEPKRMILLAFAGGFVAVVVSMYLERFSSSIDIKHLMSIEPLKPILTWMKEYAMSNNIAFDRFLLVSIFAPIIEECSKLLLAIALVLKSRENDEPIDPIVYMITVALGFAAIENMLFLIDPFVKSNLVLGIMNGNMRFIGATLLHVISSATIGMFMGFNFFDTKIKKILWTIAGLFSAIIMHSMFNFFMVNTSGNSGFATLQTIWIVVIIILLCFEKIKRLGVEKIS